MKLGAEDRKKLRALGVLGVILLGAIYYSFFSGPSVPSSPAPAQTAKDKLTADSLTAPQQEETIPRTPSRISGRAEEFHPVLRSKRKESQVDPTKIDPKIQLYRLAKLQEVPPAGSGRNLFQFGAAPPKELPRTETTVSVVKKLYPPVMDFGEKPPPPPPPPPPPTPFNAKYYGLTTPGTNGRKRAFFLDGEDIFIRSVGENVTGPFRLLQIDKDSCVVEDTHDKRRQTIPIAPEAQQTL